MFVQARDTLIIMIYKLHFFCLLAVPFSFEIDTVTLDFQVIQKSWHVWHNL